MANIKVSNLPSVSVDSPTKPDDIFMVVQNGANKRIELHSLLNNLFSNDNIYVGGHLNNGIRSGIQFVVKDKHNGDLLYVDTDTKQVGIGAPPTLTNAKLQIAGNVKIDALYVDSYELVDINRVPQPGPYNSNNPKALSLHVETSQLRIADTSYYTLNKGIPGQTKNIVVVSTEARSKTATAIVRFTHGGGLAGGVFNAIKLTGISSGCVLKYVEDKYAVATCVASIGSGSVQNISISYGGINYITTPLVSIESVDGNGSGAVAHAVVTNNSVTQVVVDNAGSGYTSPPKITLTNSDHEYWVVVASNGAELIKES